MVAAKNRERRFRAYLELLRPANVLTALADVLAGCAVAASLTADGLAWLLGATACLYAGGVVFNDVFDAELDGVERPERPIPSRRANRREAAALGTGLLVAGVAFASRATSDAALVAAAISAAVLLYDAKAKHHPIAGPVTMGACRGLNFALGLAVAVDGISTHWPLTLISFTYIVAVTVVSRGEVQGGTKRATGAALGLLLAALGALGGLAVASSEPMRLPAVVVFVWLVWRVAPPFIKAFRTSEPTAARAAVRAGVLALVLVDAVIATAYAGMITGLLVILVGLAASWVARRFAVT